MSKFFMKWILLVFSAYFAYKNRRRLMHALFGLRPLRKMAESDWAERFMDRFMYERS